MKQVLSRIVPAVAGLLLLSGTAGCSFIFVKTPPSDGGIRSRSGSEKCTSSKLAPILDTTFGAFQLVRTGLAVGAADSVYENPDAPLSREADIALGASFTALFVGSAIYGFANTSRCGRRQRADDDQPVTPDPPETWGPSVPEARPAAPQSPPVDPTPAPAASSPPEAPAPEQPAEPEPAPSHPEPGQ